MRVAVLFNAVSEQDTIEDQDILVQVEAVSQSLDRLGHETCRVGCTLDLDAMKRELERLKPELVFNLVEALAGADSLVHLPPAVLDAMGLPYCGGSAETLFATTHKIIAKERLSHAGLPTPKWFVLPSPDQPSVGARRGAGGEGGTAKSHQSGGQTFLSGEKDRQECLSSLLCNSLVGEGKKINCPHPNPLPAGEGTMRWNPLPTNLQSVPGEGKQRWIIKGVWDQASRDMDDDAVFIGNPNEVQERLRRRVERTGRPAFAEEFIEGREFNLALLARQGGVEILPPAEIDFSAFPPEKPRIVGHRAKWIADSFEYNNTPRRFDFPPADRPLLDQLRDSARRCWELFMLGGWARVDFRVDQAGQPWILEVNSNPCLSPDAGFAAALQQAGVSFDEAVRRIVACGKEREQKEERRLLNAE